MTLRQNLDAILDALKSSPTLSGVSVEFGKYGTMPTIIPSVLIYFEPDEGTTSQRGAVERTAKLNFFACVGGELNDVLSAIGAIELCEKVEKVLNALNTVVLQQTNQPPRFDDYYSDFAAAYVEFNLSYDSTQN